MVHSESSRQYFFFVGGGGVKGATAWCFLPLLEVVRLRVLSTLVAREWKSTTVLTSQFLMASSSRIQ